MSSDQANSDIIVSELSKDEDFAEIVEMFVNELPERIETMRTALESNDIESLQRAAHQLKGAAGGYGFPSITDCAKELEQSSKIQSELETIKTQLNELADMCGRARAK